MAGLTGVPAHPQKGRAHAPANHVARAKHRAAPQAHAQPKPASPRPAAPALTGVEARVQAAAEALRQGKVVVFFFSKEGPADDVATRGAVDSLRGMPRVRVFRAGLDELAAFRPMLANVGISEVPSTVIVRPGKKAVLLQGFVDAGTLRQNVADALR